MSFGSKLRDARKAKQLTQRELAIKIQAAHNSISNWENDQNMPDPDTIQNLCWVLDVDPNYFFSDSVPSGVQHIGKPIISEPPLSSAEESLVGKFRSLNTEGQSKVISYTDDLLRAGIYKNIPAPDSVSKNA